MNEMEMKARVNHRNGNNCSASLAMAFAEKLGLKTKWKTFEDFWGINNLAQEKNKSIELGKLPTRSNVIDKVFED